jgi:hypothetical protein
MWDALTSNRALSQTFRGLKLQSHPDSDKVFTTVRLIKADSIVMNDGEEVSSWSGLNADMTVSGAGGIDTGTEQSLTWYEVYAIRNPTSLAKGLLLHRAKDFLADQNYTAGEDASQGLRSAVDNSTVKVAQGLQVTVAGPLTFVDVRMLRTGAPVGNFWFTIEANSGGVPSNTPLATSDKFDAGRLLTTSNWLRIPFRTPASLSAATQYHLVLQGDYTISASNFVSWRMDGSAGAYANGSKALFDSDTSTWTTDTDDDMMFKTYITENDTAVTLPSGYTQYALIGYAFNDGLGNVTRFRQIDHMWRYAQVAADGQVVNEFSGTTASFDLRSLVPPVDMLNVWIAGTGTGAAAAVVSAGDLTGTDLIAGSIAATQFQISVSSATEVPGNPSPLMLSYSFVIADGTGGADMYISGFDW